MFRLHLKVAFFDNILLRSLYATRVKYGENFGNLHLGVQINRKLREEGLSRYAVFLEPRREDQTTNTASIKPTTLRQSAIGPQGNVTITSLTFLFTLIASITSIIAWNKSPHAPGTRHDADFWYLVQNSLLQILSTSNTIIAIRCQPWLTLEAWFWTWAFVGVALTCETVAVPLYLYAPTEWSATMAFVGSAAQAIVALQALFTVGGEVGEEKVKAE